MVRPLKILVAEFVSNIEILGLSYTSSFVVNVFGHVFEALAKLHGKGSICLAEKRILLLKNIEK